MSVELQKLVLKRLLKSGNHELYTKLTNKYFVGANLILFTKIKNFYKANLRLPSIDEFLTVKKDIVIQEYLENDLLDDSVEQKDIQNDFLISQLQDFCVREETIEFLDKFLEEFESLESFEIMDLFQSHILELNKTAPVTDECFDVADLDLFPKGDSFKLFSSGLSNQYDAYNGGFGLQELILFGGRRGSGKSIITLNMANHRFQQNNTVAFMSIEMRYKEVHDRLVSIISGVPFLNILKNTITFEEKVSIIKAKVKNFYEVDMNIYKAIDILENTKDFQKFETFFKENKPRYKDNRLFIIDDPSLTLNRIDHYCNMFANKHPAFNMIVVDYLNIIKYPDSKAWQSQVQIAEELKRISRKYDISVISPYQIDATGEARFAKGILDAADRGFNFFPPNEDDEDSIVIHTTKIRNGKAMNFDVNMDWNCVRILPESAKLTQEKAHNPVRYGPADSKEGSRDI